MGLPRLRDTALGEQALSEQLTVEKRPTRVAIRVTGTDAAHLMSDVFTGHIAAEPGPAQWWALLTPQGKILAEGLASYDADGFWLDIDATVKDNFMKRMRMYKLRADVSFADCSQSHAVGWSETPVDGLSSAADTRGGGLGQRVIVAADAATGWTEGEAYLSRRIASGVLELGPDFAADTTFPHDIAMDLLGGIDFAKGCYVGQEVVSRMKHRGTARRRPVILAGDGLEPGAPVLAGAREAGRLGAVANGHGIAILRLDRITDPAAVTVGDGTRIACPALLGRLRFQRFRRCWRGLIRAVSSERGQGTWHGFQTGRGSVCFRAGDLTCSTPRPVDIELSDIAHGLARVARWNGQTIGDYSFSVAQHSVLVMALFAAANPEATARDRLFALLHDAPEYVMGDIISPLKAAMGGDYKNLESRLLAAIHIRFSLPANRSAAISAGPSRRPTATPPISRRSIWPASNRRKPAVISALPKWHSSRSKSSIASSGHGRSRKHMTALSRSSPRSPWRLISPYFSELYSY